MADSREWQIAEYVYMTRRGRKLLLKLYEGETAGVDYNVHNTGRLNRNVRLIWQNHENFILIYGSVQILIIFIHSFIHSIGVCRM